MLYKGRLIEKIGEKEIFGRKVFWVRVLEDNSLLQIAAEDIEIQQQKNSLSSVRFVALAARIKEEIARKNILAPYESSLIPLPHQILVLEKVMQASQNRFLLADEVGMGKTIETGLILKELKLRGEVKRTLIIVPKSAMMQWQSELKEHFNEVFHLYDSDLISSLTRTFSNINADQEFNFWTQHNQIIVSTDALKPLDRRQGWSNERVDEYNKYRMEAVLSANFDLVIIDEVHKMGGSNHLVSRFQLAQALCNEVPNALLLSATPHRGKSDHFRRVLQLIDPEAFAGEGMPTIAEIEPYVIRTEKRLAVDYEGNKLFNERQTIRLDVELNEFYHSKQLRLYEDVTDYVRKGFNSAKFSKNTARGLIMVMFQRLASSSTAAILSAMRTRHTRLIAGEESDIAEDFSQEVDDDYDFENLTPENVSTIKVEPLSNEIELLEQLIAQATDCLATETDAKASKLIEYIQQLKIDNNDSDIKVLVFTEFRSTQQMLLDRLEIEGFICESINGSLDLDQRKDALRRFKGESQVMIATDAAGESLNMQFCHIVFNYDLPWNPMMIEQRIGRVDRIGQQNRVSAYNMLTTNSVDLRVYRVIEEKLNAILDQLGIDKTSDVLDSTIDVKRINQLYLQSLLDPSRFEYAGDKWLFEIKKKLSDFQSTEGALPLIKEADIDKRKAAEIKHSPLPIWLEDMIIQYAFINRGHVSKQIDGSVTMQWGEVKLNASFDSLVALNNPNLEHITLQHTLVQNILNSIPVYSVDAGICVLQSTEGDQEKGIWSLWEISAINALETKSIFIAQFVAANGKIYPAYANDIWNQLVSNTGIFSYISTIPADMGEKIMNDEFAKLESSLQNAYSNLEIAIQSELEKRIEKRANLYNFQKKGIERIGIGNIRTAKLKRLNEEYQKWVAKFEKDKRIVPNVKRIITIKING